MTNSSFIAVICGLKSEAKTVRDAVGEDIIRIDVSGTNAKRAEEIARKFCEDGATAIISVGVSGGLDPVLQPGDLLIGDKIIADDGAVYESDQYLLGSIMPALSRESGNLGKQSAMDPRFRGDKRGEGLDANIKAITGPLFGSDEIIESISKKAALFQNHGCLAVDMESHGAAKAAAQARVPFLAIRAIADPASRALPKAALNAIAEDGSPRILATLGAALRDPKQLPGLIKLGVDSDAALKTLRRDLGPLLRRVFRSLDL